jgi:hypothetical protein
MATKVEQLTAEWSEWTPEDVAGVFPANLTNERQIRWGIPILGSTRGIGFTSLISEDQEIDLLEEFELCRLTFYNNPIAGGDVDSFVATLQFDFERGESVELDLTILADNEDYLRFESFLPFTLESSRTKLEIVRVVDEAGMYVELLAAPIGGTAQFTIVGRFTSTDAESEHCVDFEPVFSPTRCTVPPICPISPLPMIEDCIVPVAPDPMTDCPEVDVAVPSTTETIRSSSSEGAPGDDGLPGCTPLVTVSYEYFLVMPHLAGVEVIPTPFGECSINIHFKFYFPVSSTYGCCAYVWCETGTTGGWELRTLDGTCDNGEEPPIDGRFEGELVWVCPCTDATTADPDCTVAEPTSFVASWEASGSPSSVSLDWVGNNGVDESDTCYEIQISDTGDTWTTIYECVGEGSSSPYSELEPAMARTSRFFRIRGERTGCNPSDWVEETLYS